MKKTTHILLALCTTIAMLAAAPVITARADCVELPADTWSCTGADTNGMDAGTDSDTVTVNAGASVENAVIGGVAIEMTNGTLTNNGDITNNEDAGAAVVAWGNTNIDNNGNVDGNGTSGAGIVNLDGDTVNDGSIQGDGTSGAGVVTDTGDVTNNGTISADGDTGTGVYTGSGNNIVTNNGTISATGVGGIAIVTDSGNDKVKLGAGSTTSGDTTAICTCGGNDTVTVGDGAVVDGIIDGGTHTDTLKFTFLKPSDLAGLNASGDSLTHNGQTYEWLNFEKLIGMIIKKVQGGKEKGEVHSGPRVFFKTDAALGVESDDKLGINVFAEPGLIAFIPFSSLESIDPGVAGLRFEVPNEHNWYVVVINLGAVEGKPDLELYQVLIYDADDTLVSDGQSFGY